MGPRVVFCGSSCGDSSRCEESAGYWGSMWSLHILIVVLFVSHYCGGAYLEPALWDGLLDDRYYYCSMLIFV